MRRLLLLPFLVAAQDENYEEPNEHVTVLTGATFSQYIEGSAKNYVPIVFFHVNWCNHCKKTVGEINAAAVELDRFKKDFTAARGYEGAPRFFMMDCSDDNIMQKQFCEEYAKDRYPNIIAVRPNGKRFIYNRPRLRQAIRWWAARISQFSTIDVPLKSLETAAKAYEPSDVYVMVYNEVGASAVNEIGQSVIDVWKDAAEDMMDGDYFFLVKDVENAGGYLTNKPEGFHIELVPNDMNFIGYDKFNAPHEWTGGARQFLTNEVKEWAAVAHYPVCNVELDLDSFWDMSHSNRPAVFLAHVDMSKEEIEEKFCDTSTVKENRGNYLFGAIKIDNGDKEEAFKKNYLLVRNYPHVFATHHQERELFYWEDQSVLSLDNFTKQNIVSLMSDDFAKVYSGGDAWATIGHGFKTRGKYAYRLAQEGVVQFLLVYGFLTLFLWGCYSCIKGLFSSGKEEAKEIEEGRGEELPADKKMKKNTRESKKKK